MLKWPSRARNAIRTLFEPLQEIEVFVEDENDEAFYKRILQQVSQDGPRIARVFALGGRNEVIKAATSYDFSNKRALFLIDGDLEWLKGYPVPKTKGIYRIDAYCIENLIISEDAIVRVFAEEIMKGDDEAKTELNFKEWISENTPPLIELFAAFATASHFSPGTPTISNGIGKLCTCNGSSKIPSLDPEKVIIERDAALAAAKAKSTIQDVEDFYHEAVRRFNSLQYSHDVISGKDYLLPLIDFYLRFLGCKVERRKLRYRLATSLDLDRFRGISDSLRSAARGA